MSPKEADFEHDYIVKYLTDYEERYTQFRDAYNIHAVHLKNRHNLITLPLLVITSSTGVIASLDSVLVLYSMTMGL
jgi:hypothetical protein